MLDLCAKFSLTFINGCLNQKFSKSPTNELWQIGSCTAKIHFPGHATAQCRGGASAESSILSSWRSNSVPESHLDRDRSFPRFFHIQWLIQAGIKRFTILVQYGTALMVNTCFSAPCSVSQVFVGPKLQFYLQWSAKILTCKQLQFDLCLTLLPSPSFHRFRFLVFQHMLLGKPIYVRNWYFSSIS